MPLCMSGGNYINAANICISPHTIKMRAQYIYAITAESPVTGKQDAQKRLDPRPETFF